jgi:hypothetical protein
MRKHRNKVDDCSIQDKVVELHYTDKEGFKVTLEMLESLLHKALESNKEPQLIIALRRNDNEVIVMKSSISIERK